MFEKIKTWFIMRQLQKLKQPTASEKSLDKELLDTQKEYLETMREMQKEQKVLEARRRINNMKNETDRAKRLLNGEEDDDEDDYEDDDEPEDEFSGILTDIAKKVIMNKVNSSISGGVPEVAQSPLKELAKNVITKKIDSMPDDKIQDTIAKVGNNPALMKYLKDEGLI